MNHGDRSMYVHGKCRCDLCRAANSRECAATQRRISAEARELREAAEARGEVYVTQRNVTHGRPVIYLTYGCRCEPCKAAYSEYRADYKRRRKQAIA